MWILYHYATCEAQGARECVGSFFFKNNFTYLSTYGCAGSSWLRRLSLVVASRGYSLVSVWQASHRMAPPVESVGSRAHQLQYLLYMGSVVMAPGL